MMRVTLDQRIQLVLSNGCSRGLVTTVVRSAATWRCGGTLRVESNSSNKQLVSVLGSVSQAAADAQHTARDALRERRSHSLATN